VISCQQLIEFCFDYLEGSLPRDEQSRFLRHLDQCPHCVTFFETYRRIPEISREALETQIPAEVKESIRSFLRSRR
jgi:anti-sigma factor RsiW